MHTPEAEQFTPALTRVFALMWLCPQTTISSFFNRAQLGKPFLQVSLFFNRAQLGKPFLQVSLFG